MGSKIFIAKESGLFNIQTCAQGEYVIRGYDTSNADSIKASEFDTVQVGLQGIEAGALQACLNIFGTVTDINGNNYPTVLIGNQWWMAENLRTATYANGEPIPNVPGSGFCSLTSGAWCHNYNYSALDSVYGKLYNWYTTVDPRGLCPSGWHVPTEDDWDSLLVFLDPSYDPSISGATTPVGGKMKSIEGYGINNIGATNESGFSGLPGGSRSTNNCAFMFVGASGSFWSSTSAGTYAISLSLSANSVNTSTGLAPNKFLGYSVRCLKD
jgi:uncharacterized protein (TIGR02145 family)